MTANDPDPIDWNKIDGWIAPDRTQSPNWNSAYALLQQWIGPTWGDFVTMLDANASLIVPSSETRGNPAQVLDHRGPEGYRRGEYVR